VLPAGAVGATRCFARNYGGTLLLPPLWAGPRGTGCRIASNGEEVRRADAPEDPFAPEKTRRVEGGASSIFQARKETAHPKREPGSSPFGDNIATIRPSRRITRSTGKETNRPSG